MENENLNQKRKELSKETRDQIIGISRAGNSERQISNILGIPKSTVHNTLVRFRTTNTTNRSGRPNLINEEKEQAMKKIVMKIHVAL